jgi:hypothetical protein
MGEIINMNQSRTNMMNEQSSFILDLLRGVEWAFDDKRQAWIRTLFDLKSKGSIYDANAVQLAKRNMLNDAKRCLEKWHSQQYSKVTPSIIKGATQKEPEDLWHELVQFNTEPFMNGPDPLGEFMIPVHSLKRGIPPLWLLPNMDGWGIRIYLDKT